jgi:methenyltetrahydromethanopterin cyclohydrolase
MQNKVSVNAHSLPIVKHLVANADKFRLKVDKLANGCTVIDAGIEAPGGLEAGRLITEICMGGLGTVTLTHNPAFPRWPLTVNVHSTNPVISCLGSQYAGWSLSHGEGKGAFYALGSGPARALATKVKDGVEKPVEELYEELGYRDACGETSIVMEVDKVPPVELIEKIARACKVDAGGVHVILTPTSSLAGSMQVVGRVLEVALHKAHSLHFPLENIVDGSASAPVPPPHPNFVKAMGRTNDAILFGGTAHLFVKGSDEAAETLANELPSSVSRDYGKPFAEVFKEYKYDFFKVDAMLFSPAKVIVTAVDSGRSFHAGQLDEALLERSFGE